MESSFTEFLRSVVFQKARRLVVFYRRSLVGVCFSTVLSCVQTLGDVSQRYWLLVSAVLLQLSKSSLH